MSVPNGMDLKVQEYGTLKVPYELLNKRFRSAQKTIDREIHGLTNVLNELEKCVESGNSSTGSVAQILGGVVERLQTLKRKAADAIELEESSALLCKRRVDHLKEHASSNPAVVSKWKKTRFNRMVVDHLLRYGYYDSALQLAKESQITDLVNTDVFIIAWEVEKSLDRRECEFCLNWCNENRSRLRKLKSTLEFQLHVQQFIELVRANRRIEAVAHARKFLSSADSSQLEEMKQVMGILAFQQETHVTPYKDLFSSGRWRTLKEQFRYENYRLHQLGTFSVFKLTLQAGMAGLKTHHCYNDSSKSPDCPICLPPFNKLAEPLPFSHCTQSRLICSISGKMMNDNNQAMMLPNGHVYGEKGLAMIAKNGKVICPRTQQEFDVSSVEKLFIVC